MVLIPVLFIVVLLIAFKLYWLLPFLLLLLIIAAGITNRLQPTFFAARRSYMMLVSLSHGSSQQITINASPFVIGRAPESDFCISDNYVSNRHLVIEFVDEENRCYATDVSTNGSYLNSVRMQNNVRRPLCQGDTLQIAGLLFRVEYVHF